MNRRAGAPNDGRSTAGGRVTDWAAAGHGPARPQNLFVVRESDEWDLVVFDAMREQTYQPYRSDPTVEAVRKLGLTPFDCQGTMIVEESLPDGTAARTNVLVETLRRGRTRALLFCYAGSWHLWSQASAVSLNADRVQEFNDILMSVITRLRPCNLRAANFSRLIRSQEQGGLLMNACSGNVDVVWAGSMKFAFTGPEANVGKMLFSMFAMVASMERDWIVQRLQAGRIAQWRRGEWPLGSSTVPFGYRLDKASRRLVPDEELRPVVREMICILAAGGTPRSIVERLGAVGVTTMRKYLRFGRKVTVNSVHNPSSLVASLYAWAPIWINGEYLFRLSCPFTGLDELAGVPVVRESDNPDDAGELQMLVKVALPVGGWAEPALLLSLRDTAIRHMSSLSRAYRVESRPLSEPVRGATADLTLLEQLLTPNNAAGRGSDWRRRTGGRAKASASPFAGRRWSDDSYVYELRAANREKYQLWRWPKVQDATSPVESADVDGVVL